MEENTVTLSEEQQEFWSDLLEYVHSELEERASLDHFTIMAFAAGNAAAMRDLKLARQGYVYIKDEWRGTEVTKHVDELVPGDARSIMREIQMNLQNHRGMRTLTTEDPNINIRVRELPGARIIVM